MTTDGDQGHATLAIADGSNGEVDLEWTSPGWLVHAAVAG